MIPDDLASLVQLPEKFWPYKRWAARKLSGEVAYGSSAENALKALLTSDMKPK